MSIKSKLILLFVTFALLPMALVASYGYRKAEDSLKEAALAHMDGMAILKAREISRFFEQTRVNLMTMQDSVNLKTNIPVLRQYRSQKSHPRYRQARTLLDGKFTRFAVNHGLNDIDIIGLDGRIIYGTYEEHADNEPYPDDVAFRRGLEGIYFSELYRSKGKDAHFLLRATAPLHDMHGQPLGVIAFEVIADNFFTTLQDTTGLGKTGETLIGKKIGDRVLFLNPLRHDPQAALTRSALLGGKLAVPMLHAATGQTGSGVAIDYRGTEVLAAWRHIPEVGWGMVAKIDTSEAFAPINELRLEILATCGALLLLGVGIAFVMARSIAVPIKALEKDAQIIGAGNLRHQVPVASRDELGSLALAFNRMTENLRETTASRDDLLKEVQIREKLERAMSVRLNELDKLNAELDEFAYIASHDLQEPLRKLIIFSEHLQKDLSGNVPPRAQDDLRYIVNAAERMQQLVRDILDLSRTGRSALNPAEVGLEKVVAQALDNLSVRLQESGAQIEIDPLPTVIGDFNLLVQLYQNLIGNALKFVGKTLPLIQLDATQVDGQWVFGVRDNGIGIDPAYAEQVFQPFKRLHGRGQYEGSGIGLSICRKIVERHGGRIWVESAEGQGAHFRFTLGMPAAGNG